MNPRSLAVLLAAVAARPAAAARVELVPDAPVLSAPSAAAPAALPLVLFASPLAVSAAPAAAPVPLAVSALPAALPALPAAAAAPVPLEPSRLAAAAPARRDGERPTLLQTVSAPLPDVSKLSGGEAAAAAESDFAARAQLDAPAAASESALPLVPASSPARSASSRRAAEADEMAQRRIPAWLQEELPVAAAKLGRPLTPEYEAAVLARSKVWVYKWHSRWTYEISGGLPDGHFDPKFGIRVMLKSDWRKLKDPETHFRVLFAHEYTHWLQDEGLVTRRYGGEIPAVAVEQLRAMELVGWEGMKAGRVGFIAESNLRSFEDGRAWARGDMKDITHLYHRGVLGGAAYEVGRIAGRPEAAWEFLNLVIAEKGGLSPREAFERVTGLRK